MKRLTCWLVGAMSAAVQLCGVASAQQQAPRMPYQEYADRIKSAEMVAPLKSDLFGDSISLYNGATEFTATDVSVPGNSALPVAVGRRLKIQSTPEFAQNLGGFGAWDIDIPHISGTFVEDWLTQQRNGQRCSNFSYPGHYYPFEPTDFYSGVQLSLPGRGEQEVLGLTNVARAQLPTDGHLYKLGTRSFDRIRCKPSIANPDPAKGLGGEAFIVRTADGLTYTLDVAFKRDGGVLEKSFFTGEDFGSATARVHRHRFYLAASKIEDRFGNSVDYHWSGDKLTGISSSDGRHISIGWEGGNIKTVSTNGRTWTYTYGLDGMRVTQPDGSYWLAHLSGSLTPGYYFGGDDGHCGEMPPAVNDPAHLPKLTLRHPSGATGVFEFLMVRHRRNGIPQTACQPIYTFRGVPTYALALPNYFDVFSMMSKTIQGPGVGTKRWQYNYEIAEGGLAGPYSAGCTACESKGTWVTEPDGVSTEHRFGAIWSVNEGRLLAKYVRDAQGKVVRSEISEYMTDEQAGTAPFSDMYGAASTGDDRTTHLIRPIVKTTVHQDGAIAGPDGTVPTGTAADRYTIANSAFDEFARAQTVNESNSVGFARAKTTTYSDNRHLWVIGQVATESIDGTQTSRTDYNAQALAWKTFSFGKPQLTLGYHGDGTLATVTDQRNNTTALTGWKRGVPGQIRFPATPESPAGATRLANVDDDGWIRSVTDDNGFLTAYRYDQMGRIDLVTYPTGDSVAWSPLSSEFRELTPTDSMPAGVTVGQWRHLVTHGNYRKATYFDAFWRPVLVHEYDAAQPGTLRSVSSAYDTDGRVVFQSYPSAAALPAEKGTWTRYDALGRVEEVANDSELGRLVSSTRYEPGLRIVATNPRRHATTTSFMAFGQPAYDLPVLIAHPEGAFTEIQRDKLGKPNAITRGNADRSVGVTRRYVYDGYAQLCKTIEPETGATVMDYDGAGNLQWSAAGLPLTSATSCDTVAARDSGRKVAREYDARNRIKLLRFPDGRGDQDWEYTPDGLPARIVTANGGAGTHVTNEYRYNKRRLPELEALTHASGALLSFGYRYNTLGALATHTYPSGQVVDYAPNALGQATQAGSYASGVSYFPNGAMKGFTYGNGIVHSLIQNARGLPERSVDALGAMRVLDDSYDYDANGNVMAISDGARSGRGNRDMSYDHLDRLLTTVSPMFGSASYSYDVLDNIRTLKAGARDHIYYYDSSWRLTNVQNSVGGASVIGLSYDAQGNLENKNGQAFRFDLGNRLREAVGKETYRYDGHGRRTEAMHKDLGAIRSMYGQDGVLRYQHNEREAKAFEYIALNGSLVAKVSDVATPAVPVVSVPGFSTNGSYTVSWNAVTGATSFDLEESRDGAAWRHIYSGSDRSRNLSERSNVSYTYRARARNSAGHGAWSVPVTIFVQRPPVAPRSIFVPHSGPNGHYVVSWQPPMVMAGSDGGEPQSYTGISTYTLEEQYNGGAWTVVYENGADLSKPFWGKWPGSHAYRVKACNPYGCSGYVLADNPVMVVYPPAAPSLNAPSDSYNGSFSVTWTASSGATHYQLDENYNGGAWTQVESTTNTGAWFSARPAGRYGYGVRACNTAGCSPTSATAAVTVTLPPGPTTVVAPASNFTGGYSISWGAVAHATYYRLEEVQAGGAWHEIYAGGALGIGVAARPDGTHHYRARACNAAGCSAYSGAAATMVSFPPPTPPAPSSAMHVVFYDDIPRHGSCWVGINSAPRATYYNLRISGYQTFYVGPQTSTMTGFGTNYCASSHQVQACNAAGCSEWSAPSQQQITEERYWNGEVPP